MRFLDGAWTARWLRACLDGAGCTHGALTERLGSHTAAQVAAGELAPLVRAARAGDRLDTLLRLFIVHVRPRLIHRSRDWHASSLDCKRLGTRIGGLLRGP